MAFRKYRGVNFFMQNVKALLARLLFATHGLVAIWKVVDVSNENEVYLLCIPMALLIGEMLVTTFCTKRGEWKW